MDIHNDSDFRTALDHLNPAQRRMAAARFTEHVLELCQDNRINSAVESAKRADLSEAELGAAAQFARAASVDSYTQCGHECNWEKQASHFVAEAARASLAAGDGSNPAWEAAMHARMARICDSVASGSGTHNSEDEAQYRILTEFLND